MNAIPQSIQILFFTICLRQMNIINYLVINIQNELKLIYTFFYAQNFNPPFPIITLPSHHNYSINIF